MYRQLKSKSTVFLKKAFGGIANVLLIGLASRIVVFLSAIIGSTIIGFTPSPGLWNLGLPIVNLFSRWDAGWYMIIAEKGYPVGNNPVGWEWAWFPLYPISMRIVSYTFIGLLSSSQAVALAGFLISNLLFFVSLVIFYKLSQIVLAKNELAFLSTIFFAFWPGSLFYSCVYSESLFMTFAVGSFYFLEKARTKSAVLAGFLAALTRSNGLVVSIPFFCRAVEKRRYNLILGSLLICSSYLLFSIYGLIMTGVFPVREIAGAQHWGKSSLIDQLSTLDIGYKLNFSLEFVFILLPLVYLLATKPLLSTQTLGLKNSQNEGKYFTFALAQLGMILVYYIEIRSIHRYAVSIIPLYWVQARLWSRSQIVGIAMLTVLVMMLSLGTLLFVTWRPYL